MVSTIQISAESGLTFSAYLSKSPEAAAAGLIICSEAFGVNYHMRAVADRFAKLGYIVVVPDLLWRIEPGIELPYNEAGLKQASEIADTFDKRAGAEDVNRTCQVLRSMSGCTGRVGVLGFCIGGAVAFAAATSGKIDACVSYYGKGIDEYVTEANSLTCPAVLHYAGSDRFIPPSVIRQVASALAPHTNIQVFEYPGVDHGFNSDDRRAYNPAAAALAMERTMDVLRRGLNSSE